MLGHMPTSNQALSLLCQTAEEVWMDIEDGLVDRLIDSMPRRIAAVVAAKGWWSKY